MQVLSTKLCSDPAPGFTMACSSWLHSSSLSRAVLPVLCRRNTCLFLPSSNFRSFHWLSSSTGNNPIYSLNRFKIFPAMSIQVQAKRGFSVKDEEIASVDDLRFEAPLDIVKYPDPRLRAKNKRIMTYDDNLKKLVDEMFDVMYRTDGIGLSAPQVGINVKLMVFNTEGLRGEGEEIVLVNPRVSKYSKKMTLFNEGCLSFPGIMGNVMSSAGCLSITVLGPSSLKVRTSRLKKGETSKWLCRYERPESVKIDARDITGVKFSFHLSELPARVFLHEFDHLEGNLFIDSMTEEVLNSIRAELEAMEKEYEDKTGLPSPERVETRLTLKVATGVGKS